MWDVRPGFLDYRRQNTINILKRIFCVIKIYLSALFSFSNKNFANQAARNGFGYNIDYALRILKFKEKSEEKSAKIFASSIRLSSVKSANIFAASHDFLIALPTRALNQWIAIVRSSCFGNVVGWFNICLCSEKWDHSKIIICVLDKRRTRFHNDSDRVWWSYHWKLSKIFLSNKLLIVSRASSTWWSFI